MKLNILCLYPNLMDLYGDLGNLKVLEYRAKKRNVNIEIDYYTIGDDKPEFNNYDLVFIGGGSEREQKLIVKDLIKYKKDIEKSIKNGVFYLLIAGGFQLFGKYYVDSIGNKVECLNVFEYYTEFVRDKKQRAVGDIILEIKILSNKVKVIGFENHAGQTYNVKYPFGKVLYGHGNIINGEYDGYWNNNVIGTYLGGSFLAKNPILSDYILSYCLNRKYNEKIILKELDDSFEEIACNEIISKLLKSK